MPSLIVSTGRLLPDFDLGNGCFGGDGDFCADQAGHNSEEYKRDQLFHNTLLTSYINGATTMERCIG